MALCGFAMTLVFYSWNYISNHTMVTQKKTMFHVEADRLAQSIAAELRKSPEVISLGENKTIFLSAGGDTVTYEFTNGVLLKNGNAMQCTSTGAHIAQFSIEKESGLADDTGLKTTMITLTEAMEDSSGNHSVISLKVRIAFQQNRADGSPRQWNF
jgi:hypothetical protein